jgi:hypothetical protein
VHLTYGRLGLGYMPLLPLSPFNFHEKKREESLALPVYISGLPFLKMEQSNARCVLHAKRLATQ